MNKTLESSKYSTRDIYLASSLIASNFNLLSIEKTGKLFIFLFDSNIPSDIHLTINDYWNGKLIVSAKNLFNAFKELKNRMYNEKYD